MYCFKKLDYIDFWEIHGAKGAKPCVFLKKINAFERT
jgi:hypothetical protein